jgi:hypothetical protein
MPGRRREIELTVERPLGPVPSEGTTVRLTTRFELGEDGRGPTHAELAQALEALRSDLDALVGAPLAATPIARGDRELTELVETYRPRQRELVDLLLADGEITPGEHRRLAEYLRPRGSGASEPTPTPTTPVATPVMAPAPVDTPIAAVPLTVDRPLVSSSEPLRPVDELLATYQITSLKQAGAVRARRQITFGEYMALKRHYEQEAKPPEKEKPPK